MEATRIWEKYQRGKEWHIRRNLYGDTEKFFNMVEGDQWNGVESGGEILSSRDFLTGIIRHKTAMVAMNTMTITYSSMNGGTKKEAYAKACDLLNAFAASKWETTKMDTKVWKIVRRACIAGDSYLFFYDKELNSQTIDRTNVYLSDEQEPDMQKQRYVIISERRFVESVKEDARKNGVGEDEISLIVADDETQTLPSEAREEVKSEDGKCTCLLYIEKKKDGIYVTRSTQHVNYQPETKVGGMLLPIASFVWEEKRGSARGIGEVRRYMNNQINANKLCVRREINNKMTGFPKPVYNQDAIENPENIDKVGASIRMKGASMQRIRDIFDYIAPQGMSQDGEKLQHELINSTRELASAGDNATGNINPERASGAAIIAVRDQQAISTTLQTSAFKQFVEDVAKIWLDIWKGYSPNGMDAGVEGASEKIPAEIVRELEVNVRIDVSPTNPFSKFAREQALENALSKKHITFEEYVDALDDDSTAPKGKFSDILQKRKERGDFPGGNKENVAEGVMENEMQLMQ